jgi:hypothetical protein
MTAKCHPAETVWGEGHGGVPAMGVVRLLGKQQPDKQYRLAPITETAAQATEAKGQKGKIAKRIFFPAALNCDSVLLLLSPDIDGHQVFHEPSGSKTGIRESFAPAHPTIRERGTLGTFGVSSAVLCATWLKHG